MCAHFTGIKPFLAALFHLVLNDIQQASQALNPSILWGSIVGCLSFPPN